LGLKIPRDWAVWTGAGPASTDLHFYSLQLCFTCFKLRARRLQSLFENTQVALNHRNGAIETQNSPQLSISWPYKSNSILMHSTSRTGFKQFPLVHNLIFDPVSQKVHAEATRVQ